MFLGKKAGCLLDVCPKAGRAGLRAVRPSRADEELLTTYGFMEVVVGVVDGIEDEARSAWSPMQVQQARSTTCLSFSDLPSRLDLTALWSGGPGGLRGQFQLPIALGPTARVG